MYITQFSDSAVSIFFYFLLEISCTILFEKKSPTQLLPVECYKTDFVNNVLATVLSLALRHTHTHTHARTHTHTHTHTHNAMLTHPNELQPTSIN